MMIEESFYKSKKVKKLKHNESVCFTMSASGFYVVKIDH